MLYWVVLAFVVGAAAGGAAVWLWLSRRPASIVPPVGPLTLDRAGPEVELDGMSQTAQRLVADLERKGVRIVPDEMAPPKPARARQRRPRR